MSKKVKLFGILLGPAAIFFLVLYFIFPGSLFGLFATIERSRAGLEQKQVSVAGWETPYLEGGAGATIVMIHGFGADKDNFTRFARYFTDQYHVIIPDLPGFGENQRQENASYSYSNQLERIIAFLDVVKIKKFHVTGNSMGGHLAGLVAESLPERVLSVTLINNAGFHSENKSEHMKILESGGENPLLVQNVDDFDRLMDFTFVNKPFVPGPLKQYFAEKAVRNRSFNQKIYKDIAEERYLLESKFRNIKAPVFVIWGDTDRVIDVSTVATMKKIKPDIKTVIMENTGHLPMLEKPQETAQFMRKFLTGLDRTGSGQ